jgi:tripartite ATP-independent transporter DctP family solute receptor
MYRRHLIAGFSATMLVIITAAPAVAQDKPVVLKLAHVYAPGTVWFDTAEAYAKAVEARTGGKVKMQIAASGSTGDYPQAIEALKIGTNHIVLQSIGTLDRYNAIAGLEAYPYLIRDLDHFKKVYYGPAGAEFSEEVAKKTGYRIIGAAYRGFRWMTTNKPVRSVDDVKGLKLRVPPLKMYRMTWDLMGANPTPMGPAELYTSLQQGVVDGQENPLETIDNSKWYEVQKYAIDTRHTVGAMTWIFSDQYYKSLSPELQKVLKEEGERSMLAASQRVADLEGTLRKKFEAAGMTFISPELAPFQAKLEPMLKEFPVLAPWVAKFQAVK